jgi:hypothetical protein
MSAPDRPSPRDSTLTGLEVWLIGTPAEIDAAARALAAIGRVVYHARRTSLAGSDAGRFRTYARIRVVATPLASPARPTEQATLPDLAA